MRDALRDGSLVPALTEFRVEPRQLFAVYPSREHLAPALRSLMDFVAERLPFA